MSKLLNNGRRIWKLDHKPFPNLNKFTIDCSKIKSLEDFKVKAIDIYNKEGLIALTNAELNSPDDFPKYFDKIRTTLFKFEGGADTRKEIGKNVLDVGVPSHVMVQPHNEMSYNQFYPTIQGFAMIEPPKGKKGPTSFCDNVGVTQKILATDFGKQLQKKGISYRRVFYDANDKNIPEMFKFLTWQNSYRVKTKEEVIELLKPYGVDMEWSKENKLTFWYKRDAYEYCPNVDKNLFFLHLSQHACYFDTFEDFKHLEDEERPAGLYWGDRAAFKNDEIHLIEDVYNEFLYSMYWKKGEAVIFNNIRWAHARDSYTLDKDEKRTIAVMTGDKTDAVGSKDSKWLI